MRALSYVLVLAAWAWFASCLSAPKPADWLEVGYRTPEQTFRTFQTGLRADQPDLEYRCLSNDFKRRAAAENGAFSEVYYREFREQLFRAQPWLKLAAKAKVKRVEELGDGRVRLVAEVDTWFHDETFAFVLVREDFYEVYADGKRVDDDFANWRELVRERGGELQLSVPLPEGLSAAKIGEVRAGREWKIDGFPERLESASAP